LTLVLDYFGLMGIIDRRLIWVRIAVFDIGVHPNNLQGGFTLSSGLRTGPFESPKESVNIGRASGSSSRLDTGTGFDIDLIWLEANVINLLIGLF
jgi:hypothetical protein